MINPDYLEIFSLGGTLKDTELPNFIVNNIGQLKRYFTYFKTQAGDLLDTSETGMTVKVPFFETGDQDRENLKHKLELFMSKIAEKATLSIGGHLVNLSSRELECLIYRDQGLSAKEMASSMGISRRTVETYFENIKVKSGLGKINQVLSICRDEGLI
jgi:DNA-binding CsgD family transcriptional regulator